MPNKQSNQSRKNRKRVAEMARKPISNLNDVQSYEPSVREQTIMPKPLPKQDAHIYRHVRTELRKIGIIAGSMIIILIILTFVM